MTTSLPTRSVLAAFAELLEYPHEPVAEAASRCEALASEENAEAARMLGFFAAFAAEHGVGELQEAYTAAFDLDSLSDLEPTCYPYVGHHLFDENHKRSAFLVGLNGRYRELGFEAEGELPDHLGVLVRFLSECDDQEFVEELMAEAVRPGLAKMIGTLDGAAEPRTGREHYFAVLIALRHVLGSDEESGEAKGARRDAGAPAATPNGRS